MFPNSGVNEYALRSEKKNIKMYFDAVQPTNVLATHVLKCF